MVPIPKLFFTNFNFLVRHPVAILVATLLYKYRKNLLKRSYSKKFWEIFYTLTLGEFILISLGDIKYIDNSIMMYNS